MTSGQQIRIRNNWYLKKCEKNIPDLVVRIVPADGRAPLDGSGLQV